MSNPAANESQAPVLPEIKPCKHMEGLVSSLSDHSLHGPALWYTKFHVATCHSCSVALIALRSLRTRLAGLSRAGGEGGPALSEDRLEKIEKALDEIDRDRVS